MRKLCVLLLCLALASCGVPSRADKSASGGSQPDATGGASPQAITTEPLAMQRATVEPTVTERAATEEPTTTQRAPTEPVAPQRTPTQPAATQHPAAEPIVAPTGDFTLQKLELPIPPPRGQAIPLLAEQQRIGELLIDATGSYTLSLEGHQPISAQSLMGTRDLSWQELALVTWPGGERALFVTEDWGNTAWWRSLYLFDFATGSRFELDLNFEKDEDRQATGRVEYMPEDRLDEPAHRRQAEFLDWIKQEYGDVNTHWSDAPHTPQLRDKIPFIPGQTIVELGGEAAASFPFREHGQRAGSITLGDAEAPRGTCEDLGTAGAIVIARTGAEPIVIEDAWQDACVWDVRRWPLDEVDEDLVFTLQARQVLECVLNPREVLLVCRDLKGGELSYIPAERATPERLANLQVEHDWLRRFEQ